MQPLTRHQIAWRAAQDLREGSYVNLGLGLPVLVANYKPADRDLMFHSENGIIGIGPIAGEHAEDPDFVDAGSLDRFRRRVRAYVKRLVHWLDHAKDEASSLVLYFYCTLVHSLVMDSFEFRDILVADCAEELQTMVDSSWSPRDLAACPAWTRTRREGDRAPLIVNLLAVANPSI